MELHVYSPIAGSPTLDPACLAAAWVAELSSEEVTIYASNNENLSPTGNLPVLITPTGTISGFIEIAARLLNRELTPVETAMTAYCQSLAVITRWNLFVVKENYEGLTRPEISASIPFPMQYNAALKLQQQAAASQPVKEKAAAKPPQESVNKLHAAILEQSLEKERARKTPRETLRRIVQITEIFNTLSPFLSDLDNSSPASLLVAANLVLLSLPRLPSRPLDSIISQNTVMRQLRDHGRSLNFRLTKFSAEIPPERAYSLWNTVAASIETLRRPSLRTPISSHADMF